MRALKELLASSGKQTRALKLANQQKATGRMQPTNSGNKEGMPKVGTLTQDLKDGKQMEECKGRLTHVSSHVSPCHSKEKR